MMNTTMKKEAIMSKVQIPNDYKIVRHKLPARLSHWLLVFCFFVTGGSGIAFFFPDFF